MKNIRSWWWLCGLLTVWACQKAPDQPAAPSEDARLTGKAVSVADFPAGIRKVFVLNEGSLGSNNATLDFLRLSDGMYITGAFRQMNPDAGAGLGDVGNDIAVHGDEVWMVINNSGIVEVLSAADETELAAIPVPTPRDIAFDDRYAYVTSWAGAFTTGSYDENGRYILTDYANPKGQLYRIDLQTRAIAGQVEVGYQPEGVTVYDGKIYVANSGGLSSQIPPDYAYDRTVSVIDAATFRVTGTIPVAVNLKSAFSDGKGRLYFTTLGNFYDVHSALYVLEADQPERVSKVTDYISVAAILGDTVYCVGTESEFDWSGAPRSYRALTVQNGAAREMTLQLDAIQPYSLAVLDAQTLLVGDAGDYFNPGSVHCLRNGTVSWTVTAGVCPGHFACW